MLGWRGGRRGERWARRVSICAGSGGRGQRVDGEEGLFAAAGSLKQSKTGKKAWGGSVLLNTTWIDGRSSLTLSLSFTLTLLACLEGERGSELANRK